MKIEIAEQLVYSYLKHIQGCRLVQTNWKSSSKWAITEYDKKRSVQLFEKIKATPAFTEIFKQSKFDQLIKQAEIDVLGINNLEGSVFGIDIAFHGGGLYYGDGTPAQVAMIVMKKIVRTILIMQCYFPEFDKYNSWFLTPRVSNAIKNELERLLVLMKEIITDENISIAFISDTEFYENVVDPLTRTLDEENDSAELFSRAFKLLKLDTGKRSIQPIKDVDSRQVFLVKNVETNEVPLIIEVENKSKLEPAVQKQTVDHMKIGQFVKFTFAKAFDQKLLSDNEIINLQDKEYSKIVFKMDWEILRRADKPTVDDKGYSRYYAKNSHNCFNLQRYKKNNLSINRLWANIFIILRSVQIYLNWKIL